MSGIICLLKSKVLRSGGISQAEQVEHVLDMYVGAVSPVARGYLSGCVVFLQSHHKTENEG